jgi:penicillin-binding protein 1A
MGDTQPLPQPPPEPGPSEPQPELRALAPSATRSRRTARTVSRRRRYAKRAALVLAALTLILIAAAAALWLATPSADEAMRLAMQQAAEHGVVFPGPAAPPNFTRPLVATEDHRFYSEPGVDPLALAHVIEGKLTSSADTGGATLDQQLAKLLYTHGEGGLVGELKEFVVAVKLNVKFAKQQILDLYAEAAYYGHGYYGLEQASCGYFGHPAKDLTVVQGAMLAGAVNAPSVDDPISDPGPARARLTHVIGRMVAVGDLTKAQGQQALRTPLGLVTSHTAAEGGAC